VKLGSSVGGIDPRIRTDCPMDSLQPEDSRDCMSELQFGGH